MNWLDSAIEVATDKQLAILITVADVKGSSPRGAGAKMLVLHDRIIDTIGGGALELDAVSTARQALEDHATNTSLKDYPLGPTLEQCCGGFVQLVFEPIDESSLNWLKSWQLALADNQPHLFETSIGTNTKKISPTKDIQTSSTELKENTLIEYVADDRQPLWIFGAGHVTKAIINTLAPLNFAITVVDQRADFITELADKPIASRHNNVSCREVASAPTGAMILVMTHSHAQDFDICHKALLRDDLSFVGLIGSGTKRARFIKRLRDKGLGDNTISRLTCPIGLGSIGDKKPEAIAISVAAQLLSLCSQASMDNNQTTEILFK
jgi:xanthine dehydrogenase accessory factor